MNSPITFTQTIARRLFRWGAISTIAGVILQFARKPFWIGFGQQRIFLFWFDLIHGMLTSNE